MRSSEVKVQAVLEDWRNTLMRIPGVTAVGRGGEHVIVYVEKVTLEVLRSIPSTLEGVKVEVRSSGKIQLLSLMQVPVLQARTDRWRPIVGGISIGHPKITAGTYSCRVFDAATGERLILSNNHVIALQWGEASVGKVGDSTLQPGPYDGGKDPADKVGELLRWVRVDLPPAENLIDAAVSRITAPEGTRDDVLDIGTFGSPITPAVGMRGRKSGRTTGTNESVVESVGATVDVRGWGTCRFVDQVIFRPAFARGGDSGSLCVDVATGRVIGLVYAGSDEVTAVCRGDHIESLLGVRFGVAPPAIPPTPGITLVQFPFVAGLLVTMTALYPPKT
jgi:hypothetical protein